MQDDEVAKLLEEVPNKSKIPFSELSPSGEKRDGKTRLRASDVDVKWIRGANHEKKKMCCQPFLDLISQFLGPSTHLSSAGNTVSHPWGMILCVFSQLGDGLLFGK